MLCGALLTDLDPPGALVSTKQIGILQQTQNGVLCGALFTDLDSPGALVSTKQIGILRQTQKQSGFPGCIGEHKTDWDPPADTEPECFVEHF